MANQVTTVSFVQVPANAGTVNAIMDAIDGDLRQVMARAQAPAPEQAGFLARIFNEPDIIAEAVVDNALTPVIAEIVDLTDKGVTFPATTKRQIKWRHWIQSDNDRFYVEYEQWILGGTTPVLLGTRRVIHADGVVASANVAYGLCHAVANYDSSDTAITTTVGTSIADGSTAGSSIGDVSTNTATLTHPIARDALKRVLGVNASPDVATATEALHASAYPVNSTTMSIFTADLATPSADGFDDDGRLECSFFILPPGDCNLVINSTHVELQITGIASDETRHRVEVFIGRAVQVAFQGS
jgi:hypothetical protein